MDSDVERLIALVREQMAMIREQAARIEELESNLRGYEGAYAALQRATAETRRRHEAGDGDPGHVNATPYRHYHLPDPDSYGTRVLTHTGGEPGHTHYTDGWGYDFHAPVEPPVGGDVG